MDFDADGNVDYVTSNKNESITVYSSSIKRTNLLKKVHQSTGATIELDYNVTNPIEKKPIGASYKMPFKKWALTKVVVFDGFVGDGENYTRYAYEYLNGYKDRKERSFLGFGETRSHLLDKNEIPYRTNVTEYFNNDMTDAQLYRPGISSDLKQFLYKKGLIKRTYILDKTKRMLNETLYTYKFYDSAKVSGEINTTTTLPSEVYVYTDKLSVLPLVTSIVNKVTTYDGEDQNKFLTKETTQKFNLYDQYANLKKYLDINRGLTVDMEYAYGVKTLPVSHRVSTSSGNQMLRLTKARSDDGLFIHEINKYSTPTNFVTFNFEYDQIGNLIKKTFPEQNGTRYYYEYDYGQFGQANSYDIYEYNYRRLSPSTIRDPFGNETRMLYNASGLPVRVKDFYGEEIYYAYDALNRLKQVKGPYDLQWTIENEYINNRLAISKHNLGQGNVLHTSMINDELGRTIQVKKQTLPNEESLTCGGQVPEFALAVSGDVIYDEFGRSIENYLSQEQIACPNTTPLNVLLTTYYPGTRRAETRINRIYDDNDRVVQELVYGTNALTTTKYAFGPDRDGIVQFSQEVTLPQGNKTISYTNEFGLTTAQKQIGDSGELWTSFVYDKIGQVEEVRNALLQETVYSYDNLGRTKSKFIPASGETVFTYDDLGNIIKKTDANGTEINYLYEFNRLTQIDEPSIETKFIYDTGGRIQRMEDLSGSQEFVYGKLGEVVEDFKTVNDVNGVPKYFRTKYKYDSWGRLLEMIYPDNERLDYIYNSVGQLTAIESNYMINYIENVKYNHFDQPYFIKYGNGVEMYQEFDITERLRASELRAPNLSNPNSPHVFSRSVYGFDKNNNIISQSNAYSQHDNVFVGGVSSRVHTYDLFNRLESSQGNWDGFYEGHDYLLNMTYNSDHSISSKDQIHYVRDKFSGRSKHSENSLNVTYKYDDSSRVRHFVGMDQESNPLHYNYSYQPNGNVSLIEKPLMLYRPNFQYHVRSFTWDANNNITRISDNNDRVIHQYVYDGKGDRVAKRMLASNGLVINGGIPQVGMYGTDEVLYPSGNISYGEYVYTKHIYANGKRVASRIEDTPNDINGIFHDPSFNTHNPSIHEGLKQTRSRQGQMGAEELNTRGPNLDVGSLELDTSSMTLCSYQINVLLNILYNSPEKSSCRDQILEIVNKHTLEGPAICLKYETDSTGQSKICTLWSAPLTFTNHCAALEEINTLICIERTEDGMIIDPETGYVYDPETGTPYDPETGIPYYPTTGEPNDMGLGGDRNSLLLDCFNNFLEFMDYYKDQSDKPAEYDELLKYKECLESYGGDCETLEGISIKTDENGVYYVDINWCSLTIPPIIEIVEPE